MFEEEAIYPVLIKRLISLYNPFKALGISKEQDFTKAKEKEHVPFKNRNNSYHLGRIAFL